MRRIYRCLGCILLLLLSFSNSSIAQKQLIDSLLQQLSNSKDEIAQSKVLVELIGAYIESKPDSAEYYANKELVLARRASLPEAEAHALRGLSYLAMQRGDYPLALELGQKTLKVSISANLKSLTERSYSSIGLIYYYMDDYPKALTYFYKTNELFSNATQPSLRADVLNNIARTLLKTGKSDSALFYCQAAIRVANEAKYLRYLGIFQNTLGEIYIALQDEQRGVELMNEGLETSIQQSNSRTLLAGLQSIAGFYFKKRQFDSTLVYLHKAINLAVTKGYPKQLYESASLMAEAFHALSREDSAYHYLQWSAEVRNKLFSQENLYRVSALEFSEQLHQQELAAAKAALLQKTRIYVLLCLVGLFVAVSFLLYRNNQHRKQAFDLLQKQKLETDKAYGQLKSTQAQLIQREKMASLGELTAGIAHEIQNPLNFINNFAELNGELVNELKGDILADRKAAALSLLGCLDENENKIKHHGRRADAIVKGMFEHSRSARTERLLTDLNALAEEYLRLSYQGFRAKDSSLNVIVETHFDPSVGCVHIIPQEVGRVLINLLNNAFYSVQQKKRLLNGSFEPQVQVSTCKTDGKIEVTIRDNGIGIPEGLLPKIYQPFFTTKPTGEGTGLGLSLSYDIITKGYGGELKVESKEGEGAEFKVQLPE